MDVTQKLEYSGPVAAPAVERPHHARDADVRSDRRLRWPLPLVAILALGVILRLYHIGHQSLWIDEARMYYQASLADIRQVFSPAFGYPEPQLYAALLHFWMRISETDTHVRLLSAIFGVATIPLVYRLLRSWFDHRVGLTAALLLAVNPFHVWYSQEARQYSALLFFSVLATLLLRVAVQRPERWAPWMAYGAAMTLAAFTHIITIFTAFVHVASCLVLPNRRRVMLRLAQTFVAVGAVTAPAVANFLILAPGSPIGQIDKQASLLTLGYVFFAQAVGFSFGPSIYEIQTNTSASVLWPYLPLVVGAAAVFAIPFVKGCHWTWRSRDHRWPFWMLTLLLLVPTGIGFAMDWAGSHTLNPRHLIVALLPVTGFLAIGLQQLRRPFKEVFCALLLAVSAVSLANYYWNDRYGKEDAKGAAAYLAAIADRTDPILVLKYDEPVRRYLPGFQVYGRAAVLPVSGPDLEQRIDTLCGRCETFFLVDLRAWHLDPDRRVEGACDRLFRRTDERAFHGIRLIRYTREL